MNALKKVLVIGSSGRIGQATVSELKARGHAVRGFDRVATPGLSDFIVGDLGDTAALKRAFEGIESLVHLAATPDDDDFLTQLLPNNIVGFYHVMEAARAAGLRRIVLASTGQVNWWQRERGPWPVRVEDPITPRYWYAAGKVFMEAIGYGFTEAHGISVIATRLGWCPRTPEQVREIATTRWAQNVYLSPGDAGRFFACAVEAPESVRYAVVFTASKPLDFDYFDPEPAKKILGFTPQESWPQGIEIVVGDTQKFLATCATPG